MEIVLFVVGVIGTVIVTWGWGWNERRRKRERVIETLRGAIRGMRGTSIGPGLTKNTPQLAMARKELRQRAHRVQAIAEQASAVLKQDEIAMTTAMAENIRLNVSEDWEHILAGMGGDMSYDSVFRNAINGLYHPIFSWLWSSREGPLTEGEATAMRRTRERICEKWEKIDLRDEYVEEFMQAYLIYREEGFDQWTAYWFATTGLGHRVTTRYGAAATDWAQNEKGEWCRTLTRPEHDLHGFCFERSLNLWREDPDFGQPTWSDRLKSTGRSQWQRLRRSWRAFQIRRRPRAEDS